MPEDMSDEPLAIHGGRPVFPDGAPTWPIPDDEVRDILISTCANAMWGRYVGPFSEALCTALRELHQVEHVLPCCSGTLAVELALRSVGVQPDDEVILAGYDFPGNFRAIEAIGAIPVLVDIDPRTWCLDAADGRASVGSVATRRRVPDAGHDRLAFAWRPGRPAAADAWARQRGVAIVEDACQAPGARVAGEVAGTWGDVGVLSFGGSKLLSAGRGGAILTRDPAIYQRAKIVMQRGNDAFPLSELQAAVLLPQLEKLSHRNAVRQSNVQQLLHACRDLTSLIPVRVDPALGTPSFYKVAFQYAGPASRVVSRAEVIAALQSEGLDVGPGFRGFVRRGPRRCRATGPLTHGAAAADETLLLHHPILLELPRVVGQVADALHKVIRWCETQMRD